MAYQQLIRDLKVINNMDPMDKKEPKQRRVIQAFQQIPRDQQIHVLKAADGLRSFVKRKSTRTHMSILGALEVVCAIAEFEILAYRSHKKPCLCEVCRRLAQ